MRKADFDEVTWEYIEFRILAARLEHEEDKDWGKHFDLIMNAFLERSQDRKDWFFEIMSLFQILITYIPKVNFSADKIQEQLVHFKVVYDMLKFIQRYNPEVISPQFKNSLLFPQLRAFEESVRLISSLHHLIYDASWLLFLNIKEKPSGVRNFFDKVISIFDEAERRELPKEIKEALNGSRYLTDANEHWEEPDHEDQDYNSMLTEAHLEQSRIFEEKLKAQFSYLSYLEKGKDGQILLQKVVDQNNRYLIHIENLKNTKHEKSDVFWEMLVNLRFIGMRDFDERATDLKETVLSYLYSFSFEDQ
jgi:hypothetical protein